jgi:hypothetical protein
MVTRTSTFPNCCNRKIASEMGLATTSAASAIATTGSVTMGTITYPNPLRSFCWPWVWERLDWFAGLLSYAAEKTDRPIHRPILFWPEAPPSRGLLLVRTGLLIIQPANLRLTQNMNGTYLTRAIANNVHIATETHGKTQNIRSFFPCLPCDSVAVYHASGLTRCHSYPG